MKNPDLCNQTPIYSAGSDVGNYSKSKSISICKARYGGRILDIDYCSKLNKSDPKGGASEYLMCLNEYTDSATTFVQCDKLPIVVVESNWDYQIKEGCYKTVTKKLIK